MSSLSQEEDEQDIAPELINLEIESLEKRVGQILSSDNCRLKWYQDKITKNWIIVQTIESKQREDSDDDDLNQPQIFYPNSNNNDLKKRNVKENELFTERKQSKSKKIKKDNNKLLQQLLNTIDLLYNVRYSDYDKKCKLIATLQNEKKELQEINDKLRSEKKSLEKNSKKEWRLKLANKEKEIEEIKSNISTQEVNLKKKNNELMYKIKELQKNKNQTPIGPLNDGNKYIKQLETQIFDQKEKFKKLEIEKNKKLYENKKLNQELEIMKKDEEWLLIDLTEYDYNLNITHTSMGPDDIKNGEEYHDEKEKEKEKEFDPLSMDKLSKKDLKKKISSLDEFGHKYSAKNLDKYNKKQLKDIIISLYISNQKLKQELRENILGVGKENVFLNIDEILNKYITLKTQYHENLHNNLLNEFEENYNVDNDDQDNDNFDDEKLTFNILYDIFFKSNQKIETEFKNLYNKIAKMIKICQERNSLQIISNVIHSTLQTHYKQLINNDDNDNDDDDQQSYFNLNKISKSIYKDIIEKYAKYQSILTSNIKRDIIKYIVHCLEMIIIIYLNKPRLHFEHLQDFNNNDMHQTFNNDLHEKCNYDDFDEENNKNQDKNNKFIEYIIFPGLSIENKLEKQKKNNNKKNKLNDKKVVLYKSQVFVC